MRSPRPTFLIIGAQKCGTTWLYEQLRQHPEVFMPDGKELEFFSYRSHLAKPGFDRYLAHFSQAGGKRAVGEATASYFWTMTNSPWCTLPSGFQTDIPGVVRQHLGDELKLIVTLRHPVQRAVSAYLHYLAMGEITAQTGFGQAIHYGGVVDIGFYARHLRNWLEYYSLDNIKVLILERDIQTRPVETLSGVFDFLSVANREFPREAAQQVAFPGSQRVMNANGVFVPGNGTSTGQQKDSYMDESGRYWRQIITAEQLLQLNEIFLPDVKELDNMLGTNLVHSWGFTS